MGQHSTRKLYFLFAALTFLAVGIVTTIVTILESEGIRGQAEQDASTGLISSLLPVLERRAGELSEDELLSFSNTAEALISDRVRAIQLWNSAGGLLASIGNAGASPAGAEPPSERLTAGGSWSQRISSPEGDVLATYTGLASGAFVGLQQDYGPIAASISHSRWRLILLTIISVAVVLVLLQTILWAATRGLRGEYDRLLYLYRSGQAIRSTLDLTGVLEQLVRDAAVHTSAEAGMATLLDAENDELILKASFETETATSAQHHRNVEEWFLRRCAVTGETVSADANSFPYDRVLGHAVGAGSEVSILSVSIPGRDKSIGVVTLVRDSSHGAFRTTELRMVEEIAAQAGMAVEQATLFGKVRAYADEVELNYDATLRALMAALDTKDSVTGGHSERVARLTVSLAREMNFPKDRLVDVERGALLHDVGKIGVPDAVLQKPGPLDDKEWEAMRKHPLLAGMMISNVKFLEGATPILLYHHERYDGAGYPFALEGKAIPLEARIFAVVDTFDAMTYDRPYRKALSVEVALREIKANAGTQFDPEVVVAFTRLIARMSGTELRAA
ncbi:MAG: HD domain-containing protein [Chloroflexi bacterium]|nr:HD domain-containing protein [Chloroflexota bacterium]